MYVKLKFDVRITFEMFLRMHRWLLYGIFTTINNNNGTLERLFVWSKDLCEFEIHPTSRDFLFALSIYLNVFFSSVQVFYNFVETSFTFVSKVFNSFPYLHIIYLERRVNFQTFPIPLAFDWLIQFISGWWKCHKETKWSISRLMYLF